MSDESPQAQEDKKKFTFPPMTHDEFHTFEKARKMSMNAAGTDAEHKLTPEEEIEVEKLAAEMPTEKPPLSDQELAEEMVSNFRWLSPSAPTPFGPVQIEVH